MPEVELTETQQTELESVRDELAEAFIDTYGHIRMQDVVDYLLDTYTPPSGATVEPQLSHADYERIATAEYPDLQQVAADVSGVPGSGIDDDQMRGQLLSTLGVTELAVRLSDLQTDAVESGSPGESDTPSDSSLPSDTHSPSETGTTAQSGSVSEPANIDDAAQEDETDQGLLSAANQLLTEHDSKWSQSDATDAPYEVTLPDGSTTSARTKDDVRQLLFKHY